ncbi:SDR family NAD(P)-dependent oxidoreductase [Streptomyces fumanus]|uniref:Short-chain dehydrogenase n=1 Tax=Streptomyces fumanus TaxID=67302 RepID=A0A919DWP8_9ACTN|nr:SDR family NAD(P)-dependent oxidoreductase [Streptomyces fumanus]GHE92546.1 short-chain dehydrogenase [Streptomyces fumanus]
MTHRPDGSPETPAPDPAPRTVVITGASDGIGAEAARQLHHRGHRVVVVGRCPRKTHAVADELGADRHVADFARLDDVRRLAAELRAAYPRIDVLANNAGGIFGDRTPTADGFDLVFQVNHLAPFLLTRLLLDRLLACRASVIQTSSAAARLFGEVVPEDLGRVTHHSPQRAYGTAKLENILFTQELHRRYHDRGLSSAAFHPGVVSSHFASAPGTFLRHVYGNPVARRLMTTPRRAARHLVWLATTRPGVDWTSGTYYERRRPARHPHPQTRDPRIARHLWDTSERLLALGHN